MAFNGFVNFGDIKGESTDKDHKDWVQGEQRVFQFVGEASRQVPPRCHTLGLHQAFLLVQ